MLCELCEPVLQRHGRASAGVAPRRSEDKSFDEAEAGIGPTRAAGGAVWPNSACLLARSNGSASSQVHPCPGLPLLLFSITIITQRADCDGACGWICAAGGRRPCRVAATSACLPISHGVASSRAHPCSDVSCTDCDGACGAICDMQNEKRGLRFARSSGAAYQSRRECGSPGGP